MHSSTRLSIPATLPLSLFASQGFKLKEYTYNMWPRAEVSLANTVVPDFAPDNINAPASIAALRLGQPFPYEPEHRAACRITV